MHLLTSSVAATVTVRRLATGGVNSNYGNIQNNFQFPGWKKECSGGFLYCNLLQWNSCTSLYIDGGNPQVPNPDGTATYGGTRFQGSVGTSCESYGTVATFNNNYMELWELDSDGHDFVTELNYQDVSLDLQCSGPWNCDAATSWMSPTNSSNVSAQIKIAVHKYQTTCDFNDEGSFCF